MWSSLVPGPEAKTPVLWPPDAKSRLIEKEPDAGKDWVQKEKGGDRVGLSEHEFKESLEDSEGQRSLICCSSWCHKDLDVT